MQVIAKERTEDQGVDGGRWTMDAGQKARQGQTDRGRAGVGAPCVVGPRRAGTKPHSGVNGHGTGMS